MMGRANDWRKTALAASLGVAALAGFTAGCTPTLRVEHKVEPVHITMDINLRVDRELDRFFDFEQPAQPPAPAPAPQTTP